MKLDPRDRHWHEYPNATMKHPQLPRPEEIRRVDEYIRAHWEQTIHDPQQRAQDKNIAPLPYPYAVPCIRGRFIWFFYWDTYWINWGLLDHDRLDWARYNIENMAYCISQFGYMPNHIPLGTNRSQPPYFALMVREYFDKTGNEPWLRWMLPWVKKEYEFWTTQRATPTGLSRHFHNADHTALRQFAEAIVNRGVIAPCATDAERLYAGTHYLAEAETGHDFTPRFGGRCADFNPVDLNANLYAYERTLAEFSRVLGTGETALWEDRAARRRELLHSLCWDADRGLFFDYDYVRQQRSSVASLSTFWPLWAGAATADQARRVADNLPLFERDHGLAACEPTGYEHKFQWGYPTLWPPLNGNVVVALDRYGFREAARRIATKYLSTVIAAFHETGQLWEKYDAVTGKLPQAEYEAQPMLDWTAGVFVRLAKYLETQPAN